MDGHRIRDLKKSLSYSFRFQGKYGNITRNALTFLCEAAVRGQEETLDGTGGTLLGTGRSVVGWDGGGLLYLQGCAALYSDPAQDLPAVLPYVF